jgi:hypothetical protein
MFDMMRQTLKLLGVALLAAFTLTATAAQAATTPKKTVHKRAKHSTRVAAGAVTTKKKTTTKAKGTSGTVTSTKKVVKKAPPTTKPR